MKKTIGERIRGLRKKKKWSQEALAELLLLPRSSISKIENDKLRISVYNLSRAARIFKVQVSYFFS